MNVVEGIYYKIDCHYTKNIQNRLSLYNLYTIDCHYTKYMQNRLSLYKKYTK